jgi:IS30 family transposase
MRAHLTVEQRRLALRLKARGLSLREIGAQVGCSHQGVALIVRQNARRLIRREGWARSRAADAAWLGRDHVGLACRGIFTVIVARLGGAVSTASREVAANGDRSQYRARNHTNYQMPPNATFYNGA